MVAAGEVAAQGGEHVLTPRWRSGTPIKRPPHIVHSRGAAWREAGTPGPWAGHGDHTALQEELTHGLLPAPPLRPASALDDSERHLRPLTPRSAPSTSSRRPRRLYEAPGLAQGDAQDGTRLGEGGDSVAGCEGGRIHRPDTCYLTHVYARQELSYLSRRVDEVTRYFLALEQMVGTGVLGPILDRAFSDLDARLKKVDQLVDPDEVQGLIDAAIRLGVEPRKYAPLRGRQAWLERGRRREELRRALAAAGEMRDPEALQGLLDEALCAGVATSELGPARERLRWLGQEALDEELLAAAARRDVAAAEASIRRGANCDARRSEGGTSLWHLAAETGDTQLVDLCSRVNAHVELADARGYTPLMVAAAGRRADMARRLLERGAEPGLATHASEQMVECEDVAVVFAAMQGDGRRLTRRLEVAGTAFDVGDELIAGEDLQMPVFRRVAGRSALHVAVLSPGSDGAEVPVLEELLGRGPNANHRDGLGRTPLWYAARGGRVAAAAALLRAGASAVATGGAMPLVAAALGQSEATAAGALEAAAAGEELCRLLLRHGGGRDPAQVREAHGRFAGDFAAACREAQSPGEALALAGGAAAAAALREHHTPGPCPSRLLLQRGQRLASAQEAAEFAAAAAAEFQALAFNLARATDGRAELPRPPSVARLRRLARAAGLVGGGSEAEALSAVDWRRLAGAVQGRLVFQGLDGVYRALGHVQEEHGHRVRAVSDNLATPPTDAGSAATGGYESTDLGVLVWLEVAGAVCLLRLTLARVVEAEHAAVMEGRWLQEELAVAIAEGSELKACEALDFASEHLDVLRTKAVLDRRLGAGADASSPAVCAAARLGAQGLLERLLAARASPDAQDAQGASALELALRSQQLPCLLALLCAGADPGKLPPELLEAPGSEEEEAFRAEARRALAQARNQRGVDALALAHLIENFDGSSASLQRAAVLLRAGADANASASAGPGRAALPLLSCAALRKSAPLARLLLEHGALVQAAGGGPDSALRASRGTAMEPAVEQQAIDELQLAVAARDLAAVHALLDVGLDPDTAVGTAHGSMSLVMFAVELEAESAVPLLKDLLQRGARLEGRASSGETVLHVAVRAQPTPDVLSVLLGYHADVHALDERGRSALMLAAAVGRPGALTMLLSAGARGAEMDPSGLDAPLHGLRAAQPGSVRLLRDHGYTMDRGKALVELFASVRSGDADRVSSLLDIVCEEYPSIAEAAEDGTEDAAHPVVPTLLMEAVRARSPRMVEILLARGALLHPQQQQQQLQEQQIPAVNVASGAPHTSTDSAVHSPSPEHSEPTGGLPHISAWALAGADEELRAALRAGLPREVLRLARAHEEAALANLRAEEELGLVPVPADLALAGEDGFNALDHALAHGLVDVEVWLVGRGARLQGMTSSDLALLEPVKAGQPETVRRRLAAGADVHSQDAQGRTAMDWCALAGIFGGIVWTCVESAFAHVEAERASERTPRSGTPRLGPSFTGFGSSEPQPQEALQAPNLSPDRELQTPSPVPDIRSERLSRSPTARSGSLLVAGAGSFAGRGVEVRTCTTPSGARSARGHQRRRLQMVLPDAAGSHAQVEVLLAEAGARFGPSVRSAMFCIQEPLEGRQYEAVRRRIAAGADCTVVGQHGLPLPHVALDAAAWELTRHLVEAGASPDSRDRRGRTVLWRAVESKHPELVSTCVASGADLSLGLGNDNAGSLAHLAMETGQVELAVSLVRGAPGLPLDHADSHGRTVLQRALELHLAEVALACLEHGADASIVDALSGRGLPQMALESKQAELVPALLRAGAKPALPDRQGRTALLVASELGDEAAASALLEAGAMPGLAGEPEAQAALEAGALGLAARLVLAAGPAKPADIRRARSAKLQRQRTQGSSSRLSASPTPSPSPLPGAAASPEPEPASLLALAVEAGAGEVAAAYLAVTLQGAGLEQSSAEKLSEPLAQWALSRSEPAALQECLVDLEELPGTLAREGPMVAATDLAQHGAPQELVEMVQRARSPARRLSTGFRRTMSKLDDPDTGQGASVAVSPAPVDLEGPGAAAERLRQQLCGGPVLCVLAPERLLGANTEELAAATAAELATKFHGQVFFITHGPPGSGIHRAFAAHCGNNGGAAPRLCHLMPDGHSTSSDGPRGGSSEELHAGGSIEACREVFAHLGDVYVAFEGGPREAEMAQTAHGRGARIVPFIRTGGASSGMFGFPEEALVRPEFLNEEQWASLRSSEAPVADAAAAAAALAAAYAPSLPAVGTVLVTPDAAAAAGSSGIRPVATPPVAAKKPGSATPAAASGAGPSAAAAAPPASAPAAKPGAASPRLQPPALATRAGAGLPEEEECYDMEDFNEENEDAGFESDGLPDSP